MCSDEYKFLPELNLEAVSKVLRALEVLSAVEW